MEAIQSRVFQSEIVIVDGHAFTDCQLIDCELRYSGGPFMMSGTLVSGCQWAFGGAAKRTMEVLSKFAVLDDDDQELELSETCPPVQLYLH